MGTVRELGEFGLIRRIADTVAKADLPRPIAGDFELRLGIGDDAAAWRIDRGTEVFTTDTVVEGVHFTQGTTPWADLGWKLWAANVSDVAAMGAIPLTGVVTLGLPATLEVEAIDDLYDGILDACRCYRTIVVGGDIVGAREVFITVGMNGFSETEPLVRDAARPGDAIAVTGPLGASTGGLRLLREGYAVDSGREELVRAHRRPRPRVDSGRTIAAAGIRCAMDLSDGLLADLRKLCEASGVGARIDASSIPVPPALRVVFPVEAERMALGGGEDYEILFAGPRALVAQATQQIAGAAIIGEVLEGSGGHVIVVDTDGKELEVEHAGWEHWPDG